MQVRRASTGWSGIQTVSVQACSPGDLCGQVEIELDLIGVVENGMMHTQVTGVIIEIGGKKVIIDALFSLPSGTGPMMEEMMGAAAAPYDGADLVLATHHHWDHFDPGIVVSYLINTPTAQFVSTDIAVTLLAQQEGFDQVADRVTSIGLARGRIDRADAQRGKPRNHVPLTWRRRACAQYRVPVQPWRPNLLPHRRYGDG